MTNAETNTTATVAERGAHGAPEKAAKPARAKQATMPRAESKGAKVLALIRRPKGATLEEVMTYASHCTSLGRSEGFSLTESLG